MPNTLKMGVVPPCMVFMMKEGPQNINGQPSISIMGVGGLVCGPMTCYSSEAALKSGH